MVLELDYLLAVLSVEWKVHVKVENLEFWWVEKMADLLVIY